MTTNDTFWTNLKPTNQTGLVLKTLIIKQLHGVAGMSLRNISACGSHPWATWSQKLVIINELITASSQ